MNDLNVFTYGYLSLTYWKNWFRNIKQFFRNIKYAWQRATKGYCDQDVWNLDNYLICLTRDSINHLAHNSWGYPGDDTPEGKTFENWKNYLEKISLLLDRSIDREFEDDKYYKNKYREAYEEYLSDPKHFQTKELPDGRYLLLDNDTPEDIELRKNYHREENKIYQKRLRDRNRAFKMLYKRWDNLWD